MKINNQPVEKVELDPNGVLDVYNIWRTIQGEGPLTGMPAVFIRLAGCVLRCRDCDTDYTSKRKMMEVKDIVKQVKSRLTKGLVVLTGGEPFRQNISPLTMALLKSYYLVQVETNGTVHPWGVPWHNSRFSVVCSPKTPKIDKGILTQPRVDWKYVVRSGWTDPDDGLPTITLGSTRPARPDWSFGPRVWVQPQDEQNEEANKANIDAALKSCFRFGYRLSLQTHKMIGLE